jgi:hypothetical protein
VRRVGSADPGGLSALWAYLEARLEEVRERKTLRGGVRVGNDRLGTSRPCRIRSMEPIRDPKILTRAIQAFDLCETAELVMKQNLRRRYPQAGEREIQRRFAAWVEKRPYTDSLPSMT